MEERHENHDELLAAGRLANTITGAGMERVAERSPRGKTHKKLVFVSVTVLEVLFRVSQELEVAQQRAHSKGPASKEGACQQAGPSRPAPQRTHSLPSHSWGLTSKLLKLRDAAHPDEELRGLSLGADGHLVTRSITSALDRDDDDDEDDEDWDEEEEEEEEEGASVLASPRSAYSVAGGSESAAVMLDRPALLGGPGSFFCVPLLRTTRSASGVSDLLVSPKRSPRRRRRRKLELAWRQYVKTAAAAQVANWDDGAASQSALVEEQSLGSCWSEAEAPPPSPGTGQPDWSDPKAAPTVFDPTAAAAPAAPASAGSAAGPVPVSPHSARAGQDSQIMGTQTPRAGQTATPGVLKPAMRPTQPPQPPQLPGAEPLQLPPVPLPSLAATLASQSHDRNLHQKLLCEVSPHQSQRAAGQASVDLAAADSSQPARSCPSDMRELQTGVTGLLSTSLPVSDGRAVPDPAVSYSQPQPLATSQTSHNQPQPATEGAPATASQASQTSHSQTSQTTQTSHSQSPTPPPMIKLSIMDISLPASHQTWIPTVSPPPPTTSPLPGLHSRAEQPAAAGMHTLPALATHVRVPTRTPPRPEDSIPNLDVVYSNPHPHPRQQHQQNNADGTNPHPHPQPHPPHQQDVAPVVAIHETRDALFTHIDGVDGMQLSEQPQQDILGELSLGSHRWLDDHMGHMADGQLPPSFPDAESAGGGCDDGDYSLGDVMWSSLTCERYMQLLQGSTMYDGSEGQRSRPGTPQGHAFGAELVECDLEVTGGVMTEQLLEQMPKQPPELLHQPQPVQLQPHQPQQVLDSAAASPPLSPRLTGVASHLPANMPQELTGAAGAMAGLPQHVLLPASAGSRQPSPSPAVGIITAPADQLPLIQLPALPITPPSQPAAAAVHAPSHTASPAGLGAQPTAPQPSVQQAVELLPQQGRSPAMATHAKLAPGGPDATSKAPLPPSSTQISVNSAANGNTAGFFVPTLIAQLAPSSPEPDVLSLGQDSASRSLPAESSSTHSDSQQMNQRRQGSPMRATRSLLEHGGSRPASRSVADAGITGGRYVKQVRSYSCDVLDTCGSASATSPASQQQQGGAASPRTRLNAAPVFSPSRPQRRAHQASPAKQPPLLVMSENRLLARIVGRETHHVILAAEASAGKLQLLDQASACFGKVSAEASGALDGPWVASQELSRPHTVPAARPHTTTPYATLGVVTELEGSFLVDPDSPTGAMGHGAPSPGPTSPASPTRPYPRPGSVIPGGLASWPGPGPASPVSPAVRLSLLSAVNQVQAAQVAPWAVALSPHETAGSSCRIFKPKDTGGGLQDVLDIPPGPVLSSPTSRYTLHCLAPDERLPFTPTRGASRSPPCPWATATSNPTSPRKEASCTPNTPGKFAPGAFKLPLLNSKELRVQTGALATVALDHHHTHARTQQGFEARKKPTKYDPAHLKGLLQLPPGCPDNVAETLRHHTLGKYLQT